MSCEFGHFWVDARRGQVFQVNPNGEGLIEITQGVKNWFKEHLPFKILKGKIEGLTDLDLDNLYKGIGISMGWDSRFKRVFLTKLDYNVKPKYVGKLEYVNREGTEYEDVNLDFLSVDKFIRVKKDTGLELSGKEVSFDNREIFEPIHFTIGYSPLFKTWISYYDFTPSFYVNHDDYFVTGYNSSQGPSMWAHLLTNKSYGVFYGKRYPWKVEFPTKETFNQKVLTHVEFWLDSIRYHNEYDYALNTSLGMDKAIIYNNSDTTGILNLVTKEKNNRFQVTNYPKINKNSTDILASYDEGKWSFNEFYNRTANIDSNLPLWNYDKNAIEKTVNQMAIKYNQSWLNRLRGDWFLIRLEGGSDSRFKQILKWTVPGEQNN